MTVVSEPTVVTGGVIKYQPTSVSAAAWHRITGVNVP